MMAEYSPNAQMDAQSFGRDLIRASLDQAPTSSRAIGTKSLEETGNRLFHDLTPHDRERFSLRPRLEAQALASARIGDFGEAYAAAQALADLDLTEALSSPARLLADSQRDSVMAYVDYRRGDYDAAESKLCNAIDAIATLISRHSLPAYAARQVFLGTHWVRIKLKRNDTKAGICAALGLLSFAEGDLASWPIHHCGPGPSACDPGDEFVAGRVVDLFELVSQIPELSTDSTEALVVGVRNHFARRCVHFPRTHAWLRLKALALTGEFDHFIPDAMRFLVGNRGESPMCWDSVAAELWRACSLHPTPLSATILSGLERAIPKLRMTSVVLTTVSERRG